MNVFEEQLIKEAVLNLHQRLPGRILSAEAATMLLGLLGKEIARVTIPTFSRCPKCGAAFIFRKPLDKIRVCSYCGFPEEGNYLVSDGLGGIVSHSDLWEAKLEDAAKAMLDFEPYKKGISPEHIAATPKRVVAAFKEYFAGCFVDIEQLLTRALFPANSYSQMIHVKNIVFHSICAHHFAQMGGTVHFAYIPDTHLIGISKIPRLVDAVARRPQIQENMTEQIVDSFMEYVKPTGCGVYITANHSCMQCRGARSQQAVTDTTALRGTFLKESTKNEFLMSLRKGH